MTRTGLEPVLPPWKGGVLTAWPTGQDNIKAGDENRTRDNSLEGCSFTTKLHPNFYKERSRRESNPRSPAWQAGMLTPTPRNHYEMEVNGIEPLTLCL